MSAGVIALIVLFVFLFIVAASGIRIVPQARAGVVERLGRYARTLDPGLALIVPFVDRVKPLLDLREQVVAFPPQPVITEDNLVVGIDTVIYFTVTDPKAATYEIANPLQAIEQLTVTTLRNVIGGLTLEETLTSRDNINSQLRVVLDEATGRWGIRVNRVELKSVEPPRTVQEAMEKQMRAERDRRATILTAEGVKQSQILTAEGEKQAAVLKAEGARTAAILRAEGESKAIETVFQAIHDGAPDQQLLSYQYLQMLPQLAQGDANKIFIIPSEFNQALGNIGSALGRIGGGEGPPKPRPKPRPSAERDAIDAKAQADAAAAAEAAERATAEAEGAATYTAPDVGIEAAGEIGGSPIEPTAPDGPEPPSPQPPPAAPPAT
jgi:regulator of protease activity HflC (stomatin/prohibitin superfamily)